MTTRAASIERWHIVFNPSSQRYPEIHALGPDGMARAIFYVCDGLVINPSSPLINEEEMQDLQTQRDRAIERSLELAKYIVNLHNSKIDGL